MNLLFYAFSSTISSSENDRQLGKGKRNKQTNTPSGKFGKNIRNLGWKKCVKMCYLFESMCLMIQFELPS